VTGVPTTERGITRAELFKLRKKILRHGLPQEWFAKSDAYGWGITLRILVPFFTAFILAPMLVTSISPWITVLLVLVMGIYGYKISFIMHDCSHNSLFRSKALNKWMGRFTGWLVGVNYDVFQQTHMLHHRHNGGPLDPQHGETEGFSGARRTILYRHIFLPLLGTRVSEVLLGYGGGYIEHDRAEPTAIAEVDLLASSTRRMWLFGTAGVQIILLALVTGFGQQLWLLLIYPVAAATLSLFLARFRTFAEHIKPDNVDVDVDDFARSHRPSWFDSLVLYDAHFNYHLEHHLFPHMPSYQLEKLFERHGEDTHTKATLGRSMVGTVKARLMQARP